MSFNRRAFIRSQALLTGAFLFSGTADAIASVARKINTVDSSATAVNIFHTNDIGGKVMPDPDGLGGLDLLSRDLACHEVSGILVDAGGFLDAGQSVEQHLEVISRMNKTGYHAATLGVPELSLGQAALADIAGSIEFALVSCNYEFSHERLKSRIEPYVILKYGNSRVGVTGIGPAASCDGLLCKDPVKSLVDIARTLKKTEKCDLIICLASLGFEEQVNNITLAENSRYVDFIVGSNASPKKINGTSVVKNAGGYDVFVSHTAPRAQVFNHTSIALTKSVEINMAVPGMKKPSKAASHLAAINSKILQNTSLV